MTSSPTARAFGPPPVTVSPFVDASPTAACPLAVLRALADRPGVALLESHDPGHRSALRSILVTRALLRLEIRGGDVRVTALDDAGAPLLPELQRRLPGSRLTADGLAAGLPVDPGDPGAVDEERLAAPSVLDAVRAVAGLVGDRETEGVLAPGLFGAFSYELADHFEALPTRKPDPLDEPDASFVLATDTIVFDHEHGRAHVVTRGMPWERHTDARARHAATLAGLAKVPDTSKVSDTFGPAGELAEVPADVSREEFERGVRFLLERIYDGDIFQAVLSRGLSVASEAATLDVYAALRAKNPSPYMFHVDLGDGVLLGSSPETFLKVEAGEIEVCPIAGTVPRGFDADGGIDPELDGRLAMSLLLDRKEQAEHAMLLDLARNDVARVSETGTCRVAQQFAVEKYSHVQHLVSRVRGRLRQPFDALHAYRAAANTGTLTGAPKVKAMELIRTTEPNARGFYGGACGYLLQDGSFDSCIVIRSLRYKDRAYHTRAGAGVVALSRPEREFDETEHKSRSCRVAVAAAEGRAS